MVFENPFYLGIKPESITPTRHIHVNGNRRSLGVIHFMGDGVVVNFGFPIRHCEI